MDLKETYLALLFCLILYIHADGMFIEQPTEVQSKPDDLYNSFKFLFPKSAEEEAKKLDYADLKDENDSEYIRDTDKTLHPLSKANGPFKRAFCNGYFGCRGWGRRWKRPIVIPVSAKSQQGKRSFCKFGQCGEEKRSFERVPPSVDRHLNDLYTYKRLFCNTYGGCPFPSKRGQELNSE